MFIVVCFSCQIIKTIIFILQDNSESSSYKIELSLSTYFCCFGGGNVCGIIKILKNENPKHLTIHFLLLKSVI